MAIIGPMGPIDPHGELGLSTRTSGHPIRSKNLRIRPRKHFFMLRSILMLPGLKIPIKSARISNFRENQVFENHDLEKKWIERNMETSEICIIFRGEPDFHYPEVPKEDLGQFKKSAGRPMMRRPLPCGTDRPFAKLRPDQSFERRRQHHIGASDQRLANPLATPWQPFGWLWLGRSMMQPLGRKPPGPLGVIFSNPWAPGGNFHNPWGPGGNFS